MISLGKALAFAVIVCAIWAIPYFIFKLLQLSPETFGVIPRQTSSILGIFTMPLMHDPKSYSHLFNNITSGFGLLFIFKLIIPKKSVLIFCTLWVVCGLLVWLFARGGNTVHIGASGVIYGLCALLAITGFILPNFKFKLLSFFIIMYYGSMVWGIIPSDPTISWDGHLLGGLAGILTCFLFKNTINGQMEKPKSYPEIENEVLEPKTDPYKDFE